MKYAIIDSGLNNEYINKQVIGGISFQINRNEIVRIPDEFNDENGHGSMVFRIIYEKANPEDEFYIVKVLERDKKGNSEILYEALKWLLYIEIKYIVVCIATEKIDVVDKYQDVVNKLSAQGKVIVSSWTNNLKSTKSYPAMLNNVISVGRGKLNNQELICDFSQDVQCIIDVDQAYIWFPDKGFQVFGGNSQATADFVAIMSSKVGNVRDIKEFKRKVATYVQLRTTESFKIGKNTVDDNILKLLQKYLGNISVDTPLWKMFGSVSELSIFLEEICNRMKIDKKLIIFRRSMFTNILIFSRAIEQIRNKYLGENES